MPTSCIISTALAMPAFAPTFWWSCTASAIWSPTVNTGFSDVIGSWKIIEISLPRIFASSPSWSVTRSRPSNRMRESSAIRPGRSTSRITESAVTDLPQPDSPTTPERAALRDLEVDAVDCAQEALARVEAGAEVLNREQRRHARATPGAAAGAGTSMWRSSCATTVAGSRVWSASSSSRCSSTVSSKLRWRS